MKLAIQQQRTSASAVFSKPDRRRFVGAFLAAALLILAGSLSSKGAELTPETLTAWDAYVKAQNARVAEYCKHHMNTAGAGRGGRG